MNLETINNKKKYKHLVNAIMELALKIGFGELPKIIIFHGNIVKVVNPKRTVMLHKNTACADNQTIQGSDVSARLLDDLLKHDSIDSDIFVIANMKIHAGVPQSYSVQALDLELCC